MIIYLFLSFRQLGLKYAEIEMDYEKLKNDKDLRANMLQEANGELLRELEKYSAQLKDTLKENGELKTLYLQVCYLCTSTKRNIEVHKLLSYVIIIQKWH